MKTVLASILVIAVVSLLMAGGIYAGFSDTETGAASFTAGTIDLHVDSQPIWTDTYQFGDMKPGQTEQVFDLVFRNAGSLAAVLTMSMDNLIEWNRGDSNGPDFEYRDDASWVFSATAATSAGTSITDTKLGGVQDRWMGYDVEIDGLEGTRQVTGYNAVSRTLSVSGAPFTIAKGTEYTLSADYNMTKEQFARLVEVTGFTADKGDVQDILDYAMAEGDANGDGKLSLYELYEWLRSDEHNDLEWTIASNGQITFTFEVRLHHVFDTSGEGQAIAGVAYTGLMDSYTGDYKLLDPDDHAGVWSALWNVPQADGIKLDFIAKLMQKDS